MSVTCKLAMIWYLMHMLHQLCLNINCQPTRQSQSTTPGNYTPYSCVDSLKSIANPVTGDAGDRAYNL